MSYIYTTTKDSRNIPISDKRIENKQKRTEHTQQYLRKGTYINNKWQLEKYYLKMQKKSVFSTISRQTISTFTRYLSLNIFWCKYV